MTANDVTKGLIDLLDEDRATVLGAVFSRPWEVEIKLRLMDRVGYETNVNQHGKSDQCVRGSLGHTAIYECLC